MTPEPDLLTNPYVGPRTFEREQGRLFFGREQEARDLLARVVSERLLLFYAQSGAGKSSLLNTRLIPGLQDEGFTVLPVSRVSGELPPGVAQVDNIYLFNLMLSLDRGAGDPGRLAHLSLAEFLAGLTTADGAHWAYVPQAFAAPAAAGGQPFVLIIDQFEEIITSHPARWREREAFFRQLDQALRDDPSLWVVLTLREDYVAALDPYAALLADRLRGRFHMERMSVAAALDAIREPASLAGRPFAAGVAEKLVEDLRQVRVPGQEATVTGQYVEPVQLQVVCYQLWERLAGSEVGDQESGGGERFITEADLAEAGNVDRALEQFYADTLAAVLADERVAAAGVSERALRTWFDKELLTETGIRNTVFRNETSDRTGTIPNAAVDGLTRRFLLHTEVRAGGAWVELVHDRFVEPIQRSNAVWFPAHLSALQRQADLWQSQGRLDGLLLSGQALVEAEQWAAPRMERLQPHEREFLAACQAARALAERERRQSRRIRSLAVATSAVAVLAILFMAAAVWFAGRSRQSAAEAKAAELKARLGELGAQSQLAVGAFPQRAALLAIEAIHKAQSEGTLHPSAAEQGLRDGLLNMGGVALTGHHQGVTELVFSPDSRWLVTAGSDRKVLLWNLRSDKLADGPRILHEFTEGDGAADVFFTNDMHWLIIFANSGTIYLWGIQSGVSGVAPVKLTTQIYYFPYPAAVSSNGRWLAVARSDPAGIVLWNLTASDIATSRIELLKYGSEYGIGDEFQLTDRWLIDLGEDGSVRLTDLDASSPVDRSFALPDSEWEFGGVSISRDEKWLKTIAPDGITLWNLREEDPTQSSIHLELTAVQTETVELSPDGRQLAGITISGTVLLWTLDEEGQISQPPETLEIPRHAVSHLTFSPGGRWLTGHGDEGSVQLWDLRPVDDSQPKQITLRHEGRLGAVIFSQDDQWVTVRGEHNFVHLWDLSQPVIDGTPIKLGGFDTKGLENIVFSPDNQWLVASGGAFIAPDYNNGTVHLWNLQRRDFYVEPVRLQAHSGPVTEAILDSDERWLITGGAWPDATVRLWDADSINPLSRPQILAWHEGSINVLAISGDNRWLATHGAGDYDPVTGDLVETPLRLWDLTAANPAAGQPITIEIETSDFAGAVFSDDGQWMVSLGEKPMLRNLHTGAQDAEPILLKGHSSSIWAAAFSRDGRRLITGGSDRTVRIWDLTVSDPNSASEIIGRHNGTVGAITISLNDQWVITASEDCQAKVWALGDGGANDRLHATLDGHSKPIQQIFITSDSQRIITTSADGTARIWDMSATGTVTNSIVLRGHTDAIVSAALSTDDRWLVTGSGSDMAGIDNSRDSTARVWDLTTKDPNQRSIILNGHKGGVTAVMIKADNRTIITAGGDGTIRTWSIGVEDLIERTCSVVGRNLKREEWAQYFPGEAYRRTCDNLPGAPTSDELLGPIGKALQQARAGDIKGAIAGFDAALALNPPAEISADYWNALCWRGATWNQATLVLDACETAVKLAPNDGGIRDSRGLARALTGDIPGTIEDFEFAVERAKQASAGRESEFVTIREAWIAALKAGADPTEVFDEATLEMLKGE